MSAPVITRFAPSPTGSLHLGNARTAFFSHLWARRSGGRFILRIEDTDVARSEARYRDGLIEDLAWLGLDWDEGPGVGGPAAPYVQSARGRKPTLRFAVPEDTTVEFTDLVHGPQIFSSADIGDFVVRREDGTAAFFFSNAVDDSSMGVTHVLRGDDHLTNTPRQLLVLDALQMRRPRYGHVGLLVGADGAPLSKRHGATSVGEFRERGFLRAAIQNHLFHLGHTGDVEGWLAPADMPAHFRPEHLGRAAARFDESQLMHWQKETLQRMSGDEISGWLQSDQPLEFIELIRHNVVLPADAELWSAVLKGELPPLGESEQRVIAAAGAAFFSAAAGAFEEAGGELKLLTQLLKERTGRKCADLFMPLRVALTGQAHGPELAGLLKRLTPDTALRRLKCHAENT